MPAPAVPRRVALFSGAIALSFVLAALLTVASAQQDTPPGDNAPGDNAPGDNAPTDNIPPPVDPPVIPDPPTETPGVGREKFELKKCIDEVNQEVRKGGDFAFGAIEDARDEDKFPDAGSDAVRELAVKALTELLRVLGGDPALSPGKCHSARWNACWARARLLKRFRGKAKTQKEVRDAMDAYLRSFERCVAIADFNYQFTAKTTGIKTLEALLAWIRAVEACCTHLEENTDEAERRFNALKDFKSGEKRGDNADDKDDDDD